MRICLDIRTETKGGTSTFIDNFLRQLSDQQCKHELLFLTNRQSDDNVPSLAEHIRTPTSSPILQLAWIQSIFPCILNAKNINIYHSLKHLGPILSPTINIYRLAAIGQYCGIYPLKFLDQLYWSHLEKILLHRADLIIAVSNYIRDFLLQSFNIPEWRVITIYNGLDEYFRPMPNLDGTDNLRRKGIQDRFILCVGNVVPVKNQETAMKAYKLLQDTSKVDCMLAIAGGTNYAHFQQLQRLVDELDLRKSVVFLGYQSKQELRELYNHAEMLVHPSLHEGLSFTLLEAMACGLPIIASRTTSNPELAGDAALYYDNPTNFDELAFRMNMLLDSSDLRARFSEKALLRARQFSWRRCVQETLAIYDKF